MAKVKRRKIEYLEFRQQNDTKSNWITVGKVSLHWRRGAFILRLSTPGERLEWAIAKADIPLWRAMFAATQEVKKTVEAIDVKA